MPASVAFYAGRATKDPDTYAEILYRPADPSKENYNAAVIARYTVSGTTTKFYQAKLVKGFLGVCFPTLFIVNAAEASLLGTMAGEGEESSCPGSNKSCADFTELPPGACLQMSPVDLQPSLPSEPIWLRIQVTNDLSGSPVVTGTMAWSCMDDAPMDATHCAGVFEHSRTDVGDPASMQNIHGQWGIEMHDIPYLIDLFRAGSWIPSGL